jgi:hypothetical protein
MKPTIIKTILLVCIAHVVASCSTSINYFPRDQITKINDNPSSVKPKYVDVFFTNEKIDFDYIKISYIEAEQGTNNELLSRLKYLAYEENANAIIDVEFYKTIRSSSSYADESVYSINSAKGVAIYAPSIIDSTKNDPSIEFNYLLQKEVIDERIQTLQGLAIALTFIITISTVIFLSR